MLLELTLALVMLLGAASTTTTDQPPPTDTNGRDARAHIIDIG